MKRVEVTWDDAASNNMWRTPADLAHAERLSILSVGYVLRTDKKEMVLAQSISEAGKFADTLAIPRGCIRKVTRL